MSITIIQSEIYSRVLEPDVRRNCYTLVSGICRTESGSMHYTHKAHTVTRYSSGLDRAFGENISGPTVISHVSGGRT